MACEHEMILREANIDLSRLGRMGPLSVGAGEDVARVLNDVMGWDLDQIKEHFDRFLRAEESRVFLNFKSNATTLAALLVGKGGDVNALAAKDPKALFKLIAGGLGGKAMLFRDEFRMILSHVDEMLSPKAAMELLAELSQYFAKGCDVADGVGDKRLAAAGAELEAARAAVGAEPSAARERARARAERGYAENIMRCCRSRCLAVRVENGVCVEEARRRIVGARHIAPPGYIDRVMATPKGWVVMLCTADGTMDRSGEQCQLAEHFGALALTIAAGRGQLMQSIDEVDEVSFHCAPGSASFVGHGRLRELGRAGMRWEALTFLCSALPPMIEHQLMPTELLDKIAFNGVMSDSLPKGALGYSNLGATLLAEVKGWSAQGIRTFVEEHDKGDEIVGKLVNSTMRLLLRPKCLGMGAGQAREMSKSLEKIGLFGSARCDADLVSSAREALGAHGASARQAARANKEYVEGKASRFAKALARHQGQEVSAAKKHERFVEELARWSPQANVEAVVEAMGRRFEQKDSPCHEPMRVQWLDASQWALARVDSQAIEDQLPNIDPARIRKEIRDSWKNVKDSLERRHPGLARMADELYGMKHLLARGPGTVDMAGRLAAQRRARPARGQKRKLGPPGEGKDSAR